MSHRRAPPREAALAQYRRRAGWYDLELAAFEPVRRRAVQALALAPGDTVFDVACGTGLSLPALVDRVGPRGHVIGIEQSPEMLDVARDRAAHAGWTQVTLVADSAEQARCGRKADAALFVFTHDVLQSDAALDNLVAQMKRGARIAAAGLQWAPPWAVPLNLFVWAAALYSVTTLTGLEAPWRRLASRLDDFAVEPMMGGAVYVASGRLRAGRG